MNHDEIIGIKILDASQLYQYLTDLLGDQYVAIDAIGDLVRVVVFSRILPVRALTQAGYPPEFSADLANLCRWFTGISLQ